MLVVYSLVNHLFDSKKSFLATLLCMTSSARHQSEITLPCTLTQFYQTLLPPIEPEFLCFYKISSYSNIHHNCEKLEVDPINPQWCYYFIFFIKVYIKANKTKQNKPLSFMLLCEIPPPSLLVSADFLPTRYPTLFTENLSFGSESSSTHQEKVYDPLNILASLLFNPHISNVLLFLLFLCTLLNTLPHLPFIT